MPHASYFCNTLHFFLPYLAAALAGFFDLPAPVIERINNFLFFVISSFTFIIDVM